MLISVIVPVHRTEDYLPRCIESVLSQKGADIELILVDDGSPDGCPRICDEYAAKDPRVKVLHQANAGVVRARDRGLDMAKGEYVFLADSDDALLEGFAEKVSAMVQGSPAPPDMLLFGFKTVFAGREELTAARLEEGFYDRKAIEERVHPVFISDHRKGSREPGVPTYLFCKMFRREYLLEHRFRDTSVAISEDAAQSFEALFFAQSLCVSHEPLYLYDRTNPASVTRRYRADLADMFAGLFAYIKAKIGGRDPEVDSQLAEYFAWRTLRAVNMEAEHKKPVGEASARLKASFERTGLLAYSRGARLPLFAGVTMGMLRAGMFRPVLTVLGIYNRIKEMRG